MQERQMLFCPYNKAHVVKATRFQQHLAKCEINYPNAKLNFCMFNSNHIVKREDAMEHFDICPDRIAHSSVFHMFALRSHNQQVLNEQPTERLNPQTSFKPISDESSEYSDALSEISIPSTYYNSDMSRKRSTPSEVSSCVANMRKHVAKLKEQPPRTGFFATAQRLAREYDEDARGIQSDISSTFSKSQYGSAFTSFSRNNDSEVRSQTTGEAPSIIWDVIRRK